MKFRPADFLYFCFLGLLGCACVRNTPPTDFYLLNANPHNTTPSDRDLSPSRVVGLGPLHIPEYLNRPQMVYEIATNQFRLDEQHRWAERLDQNVARALTLSLSTQLTPTRILPHPWPSRDKIDYQIAIEILKFHQSADGFSRFTAQWTLKQAHDTLDSRWFECDRKLSDLNFSAFVQSQNECLAELSSEISGALRNRMQAEK